MSLSDARSGAPLGRTPQIPPAIAANPPIAAFAAEPTRRAAPSTRRLAVTSVFGDALDPKTWSGAPCNLAQQLQRLGYEVSSVHLREPRSRSLWNACRHIVLTGGRSLKWESVMRDPAARMARAADVTQAARSQGINRLLHTGTLDLPDPTGSPGTTDARRWCD